jgi:hypothetical protein
MMRWVRIEDVGDTEFLIDEQTDTCSIGPVRPCPSGFDGTGPFLVTPVSVLTRTQEPRSNQLIFEEGCGAEPLPRASHVRAPVR